MTQFCSIKLEVEISSNITYILHWTNEPQFFQDNVKNKHNNKEMDNNYNAMVVNKRLHNIHIQLSSNSFYYIQYEVKMLD